MFSSLSLSRQAILLAVLAYGSFSHADVITKFLTREYTPSTCLAVTALIGLLITIPWVTFSKGWANLRGRHLKLHLARGCVIAVSSFMAVTSIKLLPLPEFYSIVFLSPIFLMIFFALIGQEKLYRHRLIAVISSFTGVLIIVGAQHQDLGIGIVTAFICVICSTMGVLLARKIGHSDPLPVYSFFPFILILLVNAPFAEWNLLTPLPKDHDALKFIALSFFILIGHIGVPLAYAKAPETSLVAPVFYTQMLWAILYGFIFFGQFPTWLTVSGAGLIIGGGLYMLLRERRMRRSPMKDIPIEIE